MCVKWILGQRFTGWRKCEGAEAELILDARNIVGESLIWDDRRNRLVWVDIIGRKIHRLDPLTLDHETWDTPDLVTSIGLRQRRRRNRRPAQRNHVVGFRRTVQDDRKDRARQSRHATE